MVAAAKKHFHWELAQCKLHHTWRATLYTGASLDDQHHLISVQRLNPRSFVALVYCLASKFGI